MKPGSHQNRPFHLLRPQKLNSELGVLKSRARLLLKLDDLRRHALHHQPQPNLLRIVRPRDNHAWREVLLKKLRRTLRSMKILPTKHNDHLRQSRWVLNHEQLRSKPEASRQEDKDECQPDTAGDDQFPFHGTSGTLSFSSPTSALRFLLSLLSPVSNLLSSGPTAESRNFRSVKPRNTRNTR